MEVAEQEKIAAFMALQLFSRTYSDPYGHGYEWVLGSVRSLFEHVDDIDIDFQITGMALSGDEATVSIAFTLSGTHDGQRGMVLGTRDEKALAVLEMKKTTINWQIISTSELKIPGVDLEKM